jgi:hypothetical protein
LVNDRVYIGSTGVGFRHRIGGHEHALKKGKHHSRLLQKAWDKYGPDAFEAKPLVWLPSDPYILLEMEGKAIEAFKSWNPDFGFNHCRFPDHSTLGTSLTDEHKQKLREAKLGRKRGPYGPRKKETKPRKKRGPMSEEQREVQRLAHLGKKQGPRSEEAKLNMALAAVERWKKPGQKENQAKNLKKQIEVDPGKQSRAGKNGAIARWRLDALEEKDLQEMTEEV